MVISISNDRLLTCHLHVGPTCQLHERVKIDADTDRWVLPASPSFQMVSNQWGLLRYLICQMLIKYVQFEVLAIYSEHINYVNLEHSMLVSWELLLLVALCPSFVYWLPDNKQESPQDWLQNLLGNHWIIYRIHWQYMNHDKYACGCYAWFVLYLITYAHRMCCACFY